jgi:hypothetical protein
LKSLTGRIVVRDLRHNPSKRVKRTIRNLSQKSERRAGSAA